MSSNYKHTNKMTSIDQCIWLIYGYNNMGGGNKAVIHANNEEELGFYVKHHLKELNWIFMYILGYNDDFRNKCCEKIPNFDFKTNTSKFRKFMKHTFTDREVYDLMKTENDGHTDDDIWLDVSKVTIMNTDQESKSESK
jgi:hypothetical protein